MPKYRVLVVRADIRRQSLSWLGKLFYKQHRIVFGSIKIMANNWLQAEEEVYSKLDVSKIKWKKSPNCKKWRVVPESVMVCCYDYHRFKRTRHGNLAT